MAPPDQILQSLATIALIGAIYLAPAIIGFARVHHHRIPILVLNALLGWTLLGWLAAFVWTAMPVKVAGARIV